MFVAPEIKLNPDVKKVPVKLRPKKQKKREPTNLSMIDEEALQLESYNEDENGLQKKNKNESPLKFQAYQP